MSAALIRTCLSLCFVAVAVAAGPAGARADTEPDAFTWSAACTEIASGGFIPLENARWYVPGEYHIVGEENGQALLNVGIGRCTDMLVDGEHVKDAFTGFVAVFIEAPDGGGVHRYYLWSNGSSRVVDERLRSLGMPSIVSKRMSLESEGTSPLVSAEGRVPRVGSDQGGYAVRLLTTGTTPVPIEAPTAYWHKGSRGLVKADFTVSLADEPAGPAVIEAEPGTVMSDLIGGQRLEGGALLARFSFEASIGVVE